MDRSRDRRSIPKSPVLRRNSGESRVGRPGCSRPATATCRPARRRRTYVPREGTSPRGLRARRPARHDDERHRASAESSSSSPQLPASVMDSNGHVPLLRHRRLRARDVYRITEVKTHKNGRPIEPVTIEKIRIFSVGNPPPIPEPDAVRSESPRNGRAEPSGSKPSPRRSERQFSVPPGSGPAARASSASSGS